MHRRLMAFAFVAALACSPTFAQTLPPSVVACADETDSLKRLVCYDKEVARYRNGATTHQSAATSPPPTASSVVPASPPPPVVAAAAHPSDSSVAPAASPPPVVAAPSPSAPPATAIAPPPGSVAPASPAASFGYNPSLERKAHPDQQPPAVNRVTVRVAAVSFKPTGETVLTLDDGQVWQETEHESHIPLRAGEEVTIKKGVLGAFYLSSPEVRGLRVKRVK